MSSQHDGLPLPLMKDLYGSTVDMPYTVLVRPPGQIFESRVQQRTLVFRTFSRPGDPA